MSQRAVGILGVGWTPSARIYRNLLARHYTWMLGDDIEREAAQERQLLEDLGVASSDRAEAVAVDLGCGPGPRTLALADMGFGAVIGVDTGQELLDELVEHARSRPAVRVVDMDLVVRCPLVPSGPVDVVVCMRDTVLHLGDPWTGSTDSSRSEGPRPDHALHPRLRAP